jgi:F-type H+-transporting ATPase subunit b
MVRTRTLLGVAAFAFALGAPLAGSAVAQEGEEHPEAAEEIIHAVEGLEGLSEEEREEVIHALEEEAEANGAAEFDVHCIPLLLEGGTVEDCQASPNPLLPETNEIIWGSIGFFIVFGFLAWKGYPAMKKTMEARTDRIRNDLEGAESAKADAQRVLEEYRAQLSDAKAEAGRIIEEARGQADTLKREQESRLQSELAAMRERAAADVEAARVQALTDLSAEVGQLVAQGVERVVRGGIDPATQQRLVDEYISGLAARSN